VTELQAISHAEQMEAHRRDFLREWAPWIRRLAFAGMDADEICVLQIKCWEQWLCARGLEEKR
jgi:hypothetical protein